MNAREKYYSAAPISKGTPKRILKERKRRQRVKTTAEVREYVFARERNICRCCRKRAADSMHEIIFRSRGGKISKRNSLAACGDGVRGCHGFMQRHEIVVQWNGTQSAEGLLTFRPTTPAAAEWMGIKAYESIESAPMREMEAEI